MHKIAILVSAIMPNFRLFNVIQQNVLCNFLQTIVMLNAIMPSVIMLNVFISNVIALNIVTWEFYNTRYHFERPIYLLMLVKDLGLSVDFFSLVK
jgi:hypothetical protein